MTDQEWSEFYALGTKLGDLCRSEARGTAMWCAAVGKLVNEIAQYCRPEEEPAPQDDPRDRELERLRAQLVQMEKDHREYMLQAAAEARHRERFPDEPP